MKQLEFTNILTNLSKLEIEDHGFDFSITIYQVFQFKEDCNDELRVSFISKKAAIKWIERNTTEDNKFYWLRNYVWFNN